MGPLGHVTILLWIGLSSLLLLSPTVRATVSCTDQEIPAGCNTSIVCNFTQDINAGRLEIAINRFPINTTTDDISSRKQVLSCNWGTGDSEPQCVLGPGYTSKYIDGSIAAVRVDSATKELEGIYRCQLINQNVQITNCKPNVKPPGKCEHENSLVPTNPTNPSRASSPQETESAHWRVVAIVFIVLFIIAIAFPIAIFFAHCKHRKIGELPKRFRALCSFDDSPRSDVEREEGMPLKKQNAEPNTDIATQTDTKTLEDEINKLTEKYKRLRAQHTSQTEENENLKKDKSQLETKNDDHMRSYNELTTRYNSLIIEFTKLQNEVQSSKTSSRHEATGTTNRPTPREDPRSRNPESRHNNRNNYD